MGKLILFVVAALFLILASGDAEAALFGCSIRNTTCLSNETLLVRVNSSEGTTPNNTHAQLANFSARVYPYRVCCYTDAFRRMNNTCDGTRVLGLDDTSNAHVQRGTNTSYAQSACLNVTAGNVSCEFPNDACTAGYFSVASIASSDFSDNTSNAHLAEFGEYKRKICCQTGGQTRPTVAFANISPTNTTTRLDITCLNGSVNDADGDTVTLHYNWYMNGTNIMLLNLPMSYDTASGKTFDISGNGQHGTVDGATFLPTGGQIGGGFSFDGVNDDISFSDTSLGGFGRTGDFSIAAWFVNDNKDADYDFIFSKTKDSNEYYRLGLSNTHKLKFALDDSTNGHSSVTTTQNYNDSQWHHVVATRTESGTNLTIYVDGAQVASSGSQPSSNTSWTAGPYVGSYNSASHFFEGTIDEVILFSRALTKQEILTLYNSNNRMFNSTELVRGEYWNCSIVPVDSTGLNGTTARSNQTYVDGSKPLAVTLLYPIDNNQSVLERTINFNWTAAEERDNDEVTYLFNLSVASGPCAVETEQTGITESNFTFGVLCTDQLYEWNVTACDIEGCSTVSDTFNFTIASLLSISFINSNTDFGVLSAGQNITTDDHSPLPFVIVNDGNLQANITANGTDPLYDSLALNNVAFQFKVENNETGSANITGSQNTYTPVTDTPLWLIKQFEYADANDQVEVHINLSVPTDEGPGDKGANITFRAYSTE